MKERLIKLLEVKSIITITLVSVACCGFLTGLINAETFGGWVGMVLVYFFTKPKEKE